MEWKGVARVREIGMSGTGNVVKGRAGLVKGKQAGGRAVE